MSAGGAVLHLWRLDEGDGVYWIVSATAAGAVARFMETDHAGEGDVSVEQVQDGDSIWRDMDDGQEPPPGARIKDGRARAAAGEWAAHIGEGGFLGETES